MTYGVRSKRLRLLQYAISCRYAHWRDTQNFYKNMAGSIVARFQGKLNVPKGSHINTPTEVFLFRTLFEDGAPNSSTIEHATVIHPDLQICTIVSNFTKSEP